MHHGVKIEIAELLHGLEERREDDGRLCEGQVGVWCGALGQPLDALNGRVQKVKKGSWAWRENCANCGTATVSVIVWCRESQADEIGGLLSPCRNRQEVSWRGVWRSCFYFDVSCNTKILQRNSFRVNVKHLILSPYGSCRGFSGQLKPTRFARKSRTINHKHLDRSTLSCLLGHFERLRSSRKKNECGGKLKRMRMMLPKKS